MINEFKDFIDKQKLFKKEDKILLAVSGGIDSVVMLDLFQKAGFDFAIAHINFKLRLFESDDDEMFVRSLAHKYNVDVFVNWCNTKDYAKKNKQSIQEAARELRYAWFDQVCKHNDFSYIAVAHHKDDNIETFFINLARGGGLKGLKGIVAKREKILRPLLFASRKEIENYAKEHSLEYREDSSNSSDHYQRNKLRHHLIPMMETISDGYLSAITKSIDHLYDADLLLDSVIREKTQALFITESNGSRKIKISELLKLKPLCVWLFYLFNGYGFSRSVTDSLCSVLEEGINPGLKFKSSEYEMLIDRDHIIIREIISDIKIKEFLIRSDSVYITEPIKLNFELHPKTSDFDFIKNKDIAYFDNEKLKYPLVIRKWKRGDRIFPFGMKGSKLVSDILIDNKVDSFSKDYVHVILSGDEIIWVVGHRSSEKYKVTESTRNILLMQFLRNPSGFDLELFKESDV